MVWHIGQDQMPLHVETTKQKPAISLILLVQGSLPSPFPHYYFTRQMSHIYGYSVYDGLLALDRNCPLDELTRGLADVLHASASSFPI